MQTLRKRSTPPPVRTFHVNTPLDKVDKPDCMVEMISPLWAIQKTTKPAEVNMNIEPFAFEFSPMVPLGFKPPSAVKKHLFNVQVQMTVNKTKVHKGDT